MTGIAYHCVREDLIVGKYRDFLALLPSVRVTEVTSGLIRGQVRARIRFEVRCVDRAHRVAHCGKTDRPHIHVFIMRNFSHD
jgi:hypothetical protein